MKRNSLRAHIGGVCLLLLLCSTLLILCTLPAMAGEWKVGHVVVAIPGGDIEVIDPNNPSTPVDALVSLGVTGRVGGCAFDSSYRIRCVGYGDQDVVKLALQHPHAATRTFSVSGNPQSILYAGSNNDFIVGYAGGLVQRYGYNGNLLKACGPVATDASNTFWMDVWGDAAQTIVYTSGVGNGSKATLSKLTISPTACGSVSSIFTVKLASGQAFYGVRALPSSGVINGTGGYIIAVGTDILQLSSSGTLVKSFAAAAGEASNNWRAVALSPDRTLFWSVNLATGHLFAFNIATGAKQAGPITTSAGTSDDVGGIAVVGADDAAQPVVQTRTLSLTSAANTGIALFSDIPACFGTCGPANKVTMTLNGLTGDASVPVRFTEVDPVVGISDTGLVCTHESQDGNKCVVWEVEINTTAAFDTADLLFFSPFSGNHPTLLENLATDVLSLISQGTLIVKTCTINCPKSVFSVNELPTTGTAVSGGWQTPITDISNVYTGGSISTKFIVSNNGIPVPTSTYNCSTTALTNCPGLFIDRLRDRQSPTDIAPPQGNTGGSGSATARFRPGGDGITWVVTVDTTALDPGCYIFTGKDPQDRFAPFSYSTTTNPLTTILRIGTKSTVPNVATCQGLADQILLHVQ